MKKFLLKALNFIAQPVPYPMAIIWHLILFGTIIWVVCGSPAQVQVWQLLVGALCSIVAGFLLVVVAIGLISSEEDVEQPE